MQNNFLIFIILFSKMIANSYQKQSQLREQTFNRLVQIVDAAAAYKICCLLHDQIDFMQELMSHSDEMFSDLVFTLYQDQIKEKEQPNTNSSKIIKINSRKSSTINPEDKGLAFKGLDHTQKSLSRHAQHTRDSKFIKQKYTSVNQRYEESQKPKQTKIFQLKVENLFNKYIAKQVMKLMEENSEQIGQMIQLKDSELKSQISILLSLPEQNKERVEKLAQEMEPIINQFKQYLKTYNFGDIQEFQRFYKHYKTLKVIQQRNLLRQAQRVGNKSDPESFLKQLLLVDSAFYWISKGNRLRQTQLLAIYLFLYKPQCKRLLLQILTGEGKTATISCLAGILGLRNYFVDIITTNSVLAKRDAQEQSQFYGKIGLKSTHNFCEPQANQKPKDCYIKGVIVYGTPHSYQADLLFDEYKKYGTRNKRPYQIAIVDEVDSMFIDAKQHQTLLASTYPGFRQLLVPMRVLWQYVQNHTFIKQDGKTFCFLHGQKDGEVIKGQAKDIMKVVAQDIRTKFKNQIIPYWRQDYIQFSIEPWIQSALNAAHVFHKNQDYLVQDQKIVPIDKVNTGSLMRNVQWQHGLHQFLQLKENIPVTTQGMTSNFISNIGHFLRYQNIYGLTGTLGSKQAFSFLKETYKIQLLSIPPYKKRRLEMLDGYAMYNDFEWTGRVQKRVQQMVSKKRAVLLICQSIEHTQLFGLLLQKIALPTIIRTGEQQSLKEISKRVSCGDLIISTNISGRGTDLKLTNQLIQRGGLHVIITFMPQNSRVENQARGRAGRNGNPGSSQLIINYSQYMEQLGCPIISELQYVLGNFENNIQTLKNTFRDEIQKKRMRKDRQRVKNLITKDTIFKQYCQTITKIPDFQTNRAKRNAIQQHWAMFLKKVEIMKLNDQEIMANIDQITNYYLKQSDKPNFYNPNQLIDRGIHCYNQGNLAQAKKIFDTVPVEASLKTKIAAKTHAMVAGINNNPQSKQTIQRELKKVCEALPLIQQRKKYNEGIHLYDAAQENLQDMAKNKEKKEINDFKVKQKQQYIPKQQLNNIANIPDKKQQPRNISNIAQNVLLDEIANNIKQCVESYQKLGQNQYIEFQVQPLSELVDITPENQSQMKKTIEQYEAEGFRKIKPKIITKQKKKVPFWKRVLVFCLGVVQICVGAMILAASAGAAAPLGVHMITEGLRDCYNAVFNPQQIANLSKYFGEKTLSYAFTLATIGMSGISQLAKMSKNGFQLIKNTSMANVLSTAFTSISQGLAKYPGNFQHIAQSMIFSGLTNKINKTQSRFHIPQRQNDVLTVMKNPDFKKTVKNMQEEEKTLDFIGEQIKKRFEANAQKIIDEIIEKEYPNLLKEIKEMAIEDKYILLLIRSSFKIIFDQRFNGQQREKIYKEMLVFISKEIENPDLAKLTINQFKIDQMIIHGMKNISKSELYEKLIQHSEVEIHNLIIAQLNKVSQKYKNEAKHIHNQIEKEQREINNNGQITVNQRNQNIKNLNSKINLFNDKNEKLKSYFKCVEQNTNHNLMKWLKQKQIFVNGKIQNTSSLNPYFRQALSNVRLKQPTGQQIKDCLKNQAYNCFNILAVKAIIQIFDLQSHSKKSLSEISKIIYQRKPTN